MVPYAKSKKRTSVALFVQSTRVSSNHRVTFRKIAPNQLATVFVQIMRVLPFLLLLSKWYGAKNLQVMGHFVPELPKEKLIFLPTNLTMAEICTKSCFIFHPGNYHHLYRNIMSQLNGLAIWIISLYSVWYSLFH